MGAPGSHCHSPQATGEPGLSLALHSHSLLQSPKPNITDQWGNTHTNLSFDCAFFLQVCDPQQESSSTLWSNTCLLRLSEENIIAKDLGYSVDAEYTVAASSFICIKIHVNLLKAASPTLYTIVSFILQSHFPSHPWNVKDFKWPYSYNLTPFMENMQNFPKSFTLDSQIMDDLLISFLSFFLFCFLLNIFQHSFSSEVRTILWLLCTGPG